MYFGNKESNVNAYVCCKMLAMLYQWQYAAIKKYLIQNDIKIQSPGLINKLLVINHLNIKSMFQIVLSQKLLLFDSKYKTY